MKIANPFKMNDWNIKKFLVVVLYTQFLVWILIAVDTLGMKIPVLRQLVCTIYLAFIPGLLILRTLRLHKLSNIESILYSVGLSISTLMFVGFIINIIYAMLGIYNPISIKYLIVTISLIVLVLSATSYFQDRKYSNPDFIEFSEIFSAKSLFLLLIFFLSMLGAVFINLYDAHYIYLSLVLLLILIAAIIACSNFFPEKLYPVAIFVSTISLLMSHSSISNYLRGWDIQVEYYLASLVIKNSFWDYSISLSNVNSSLSVVLLAPIFSIISNLNLIHTFKIVYPFIFSLVPVGLYQLFESQLQNKKLSYLSVFFFISFFVFYEEMLQLARQQIAELYLVLVLLLFFNDTIPKAKKSLLLIVFVSSVCISHYGLTYIFIFQLIAVICLVSLGLKLNIYRDSSETRIRKSFVLLFIVFSLAWYIYTSSSSAFISLILIGDQIYSSIFKDFLNPASSDGLSLVMMQTTSLWQYMSKLTHMIAQFFISIGALNLFVRYIPIKWSKEYTVLCFVSYVLLIASLIVPFLSNAYNTSRLYHIALIIISPLCIIGGIAFFKIIYSLFRANFSQKYMKKSIRALMIFFAAFMLFNSGFVSDIANNRIFSFVTSGMDMFAPCYNDREVQCAKWIYGAKNSETIYADEYRCLLLKGMNWTEAYNLPASVELGSNGSDVIVVDAKNCYLYLGTLNISGQIFLISYLKGEIFVRDYLKLGDILKNKIYSNGGAEMYY
ncbi:DUF2206 domain-containing protein [Methanosarcina mazei]|uniref:DUF2206 domain-containing protein n=1 Tax=Methanosarcina mazei SarPi TaxID=1434115 RepID=A0A0E3LSC8_METMZ|nr:DUF2206 domain-containing protein [Methanosarcina mazei]AKB61546.1 hypothetical protein MSMAP_1561 [Methanosarcina mazei SarPi]